MIRSALLANAAFALLLLLPAHAARADEASTYQAEVATGVGTSVGGGRYEDRFSSSYELGVRGLQQLLASDGGSWRLAGELALDAVSLDWDAFPGVEMTRWRALVGGQLELRVASRVGLLVRALVGADHYRSGGIQVVDGDRLGTLRERGVALATELGAGVRVAVGPFVLGAQVAVPVAFYGSVDHVWSTGEPYVPPYVPARRSAFIQSTAVDVETLLTFGMSF